jgi:hypothetical protein
MPWLEDSDMPAARAWAELGWPLLRRASQPRHPRPSGQRVRRARRLSSLESNAGFAIEELGMTPVARVALRASATDAALDLAGACAVGEASEPRAFESETPASSSAEGWNTLTWSDSIGDEVKALRARSVGRCRRQGGYRAPCSRRAAGATPCPPKRRHRLHAILRRRSLNSPRYANESYSPVVSTRNACAENTG